MAAGGPRTRETEITKTAYIWVTGGWGFETCRILKGEIDDIPGMDDIHAFCDKNTIELIESGAIYLYYLGAYEYQDTITEELPAIIVRTHYKTDTVMVTAWDELQDQSIIRIEATINGSPAVCDSVTATQEIPAGLACSFPVYQRPANISIIAYSSYGDHSKKYQLRIANRVSNDPNFIHSDNKQDTVIGDTAYTKYSIYHDLPLAWGAIPGPDIPPWLAATEDLYTSQYLYYLAGQLLVNRLETAQNCNNNGVHDGYATPCGVLAAFPTVLVYQNQYNDQINAAAAAWGISNAVIKRVIAVESQFYPTALGTAGETGLYQMTREGADTILRWDWITYNDLCYIYFGDCTDKPYDNLAAWQRDLLINHILNDPNNIDYLAAALLANGYQVKRLLSNVLGIETPGDYFTYTELWRITIGNYHTGATITAAALDQLSQLDQSINWDNYAAALDRVSPGGLSYIHMVTLGKDY